MKRTPDAAGRPPSSWPRPTVSALVFAPEFAPRIRGAIAALWVTGAVIAGVVAPLAAVHEGLVSGLPFAVVAIALVALAVGTARGACWALSSSVVLLALQLLGAIGSAWELLHGADGSKAAALRRLGLDPTFGVALNLVYSCVAFALFVWAWQRGGR